MKRFAMALLILVGCGAPSSTPPHETASVETVSSVGLVVGLNGTGGDSALTQAMLGNLGGSDSNAKNCSVVVITAKLRRDTRIGSKVDVVVSPMDNATRLSGGLLLETSLQGPDGTTRGIAQGVVSKANRIKAGAVINVVE